MKKSNPSYGRKRKRRYDSEFKANTLRLVSEGRSVSSVANSLGIDKSLIYAWRRKAHPISESEAAEQSENELLRKRVVELEQERDILKKALAIFSRKTGD